MPAGLIFAEAPSWLMNNHLLPVSTHGPRSVCALRERTVVPPPPTRTPILLGQGPTLMTSFILITSLNALFPNIIIVGG